MAEQQKERSDDELLKELEKVDISFKLPTKEEREYTEMSAKEIVQSNFFGEKNIMAAKVKVRICLNLKIDPFLFYKHVQITPYGSKNDLTLSAYLMSFLILRTFPNAIKSQGWIGEGDNLEFRMAVQRPGRKTVPFSFGIKDAIKAHLILVKPDGTRSAKNMNWFKYDLDMTRSRCISRMARTEFPDVLGGIIYTPEDFDEVFKDD